MAKVYGKNLMILTQVSSSAEDATSIPLAKSCTLEIDQNLSDAATKDENDMFDEQEITGMSWKMNTSNLICKNIQTNPHVLKNVIDNTLAGSSYNLFWSNVAAHGAALDFDTAGWTGTHLYNGTAIITSLELSFPVDDDATMDIEFTGKGAITDVQD